MSGEGCSSCAQGCARCANGEQVRILYRDSATRMRARLASVLRDLDELAKAALAFARGAEVRSWPPGFRLRDDLNAKATKALTPPSATTGPGTGAEALTADAALAIVPKCPDCSTPGAPEPTSGRAMWRCPTCRNRWSDPAPASGAPGGPTS